MYKKGFSKQYVLFFPLNNTIPMPNENAVYHLFLDILVHVLEILWLMFFLLL